MVGRLTRATSLVVLLGSLPTVGVAADAQTPDAVPDVSAVPGAKDPAGAVPEWLDAVLGTLQFGPVLTTHRLRGLRPEVIGAMFSAADGGDLPIEVLALALGQSVALFVEIDGADFLRHNQAEVARVEVYVYALADGSRVAAHLAEMFTVDVGALGESIWQSGLKFNGSLELPAGSYELRVQVLNYQSGARGMRRVRVEGANF